MADTGEESQRRKEEGMAQALSKSSVKPWRDRFEDAVLALPSGAVFTSEDITLLNHVGLPSGKLVMNGNGAVGAVMNALAKQGVIVKTGKRVSSRRPSNHGAELNLWMRV